MQPLLSQPWHKIADLAGGRGVQAEWQNFPSDLLTLTRDEATAIPCNGISGCYMNVIKHGPGDIVGICTSDAKQCDRRTLSKAEIAIYRLNHQQLAKKIAEAIGFTEQLEQITGQGPLWKLGTLNPQAEHNFTVYCFLGQTSSQLEKAANQLSMTHEAPFVLIASFSGLISTACTDASNRHKSKVLGIDDILGVDDEGTVQAKESAQTVIKNWLDIVLPKSAKHRQKTSLGIGQIMHLKDLSAIGVYLHGAEWSAPLAKDVGIAERTMRAIKAGTRRVPDGLADDIYHLAAKRQVMEILPLLLDIAEKNGLPETVELKVYSDDSNVQPVHKRTWSNDADYRIKQHIVTLFAEKGINAEIVKV